MSVPRPAATGSAPVDAASMCSCHTTALPTPGGEILLLRVCGDIDVASVHVLATALADATARRPGQLVVDVTGLGFCSAHGLALLVYAGTGAPVERTRHVLCGARPAIRRHLGLLWAPEELPAQFPEVGSAVLSTMADQRNRRTAVDRAVRPVLRAMPDAVPDDDVLDRDLIVRARAGDREAYRELAHRHRTRMYRSALRMLGAADDPADVADDVADDIAARLRAALAAFGAASPP